MQTEKPVGAALEWKPAQLPPRTPMTGVRAMLRPVAAADDAAALYEASHSAGADDPIWTYLPYGPFRDEREFRDWLSWAEASEDPLFHTITTVPEERPSGIAAYLRIKPEHGVIEIGHIWFGIHLQRTAAATEAIYLLARRSFDELGYRRLEWKCDSLNEPSRRAAERFGFRFEGVFRHHMVVKGRNRDTAWYAITDGEWPPIREGFEAWLAPGNFDSAGAQLRSLGDLIEVVRS